MLAAYWHDQREMRIIHAIGGSLATLRPLAMLSMALVVLPLAACWESKQTIMANCKVRALEPVEIKPEFITVDPAVIPAVISYVSNCMIAAGYSKSKHLPNICREDFQIGAFDYCWE